MELENHFVVWPKNTNINTNTHTETERQRAMRNNQVRLNCGITMPVIGLGTYSSQNDRETTELAIHMALKVQTVHTIVYYIKIKQKNIFFTYLFIFSNFSCFSNGDFTTIKYKNNNFSVFHTLFHYC